MTAGKSFELQLSQVAVEVRHADYGDEILEGSLTCSNPRCLREYLILDGIPVLVADGASWLASQSHGVLLREDLSSFALSMLGDMSGSGSAFDRDRTNNGIYAHAHWAPEAPAYVSMFEQAATLLAAPPGGVWLDVGCSLGRGAVELAARGAEIVVGLDLSFAMLRQAQRIRRERRVTYSKRRVGVVFDDIAYDLDDYPGAVVSFWCADVAAMPFADGTFAGAMALNVLDCVPQPLSLLTEMGRVVRDGGEAVVASPFDWAIGATQLPYWIGGHSQRTTPGAGSSVAVLRYYLQHMKLGWTLDAERDGIAWRLETNERSVTEYNVFAARLVRQP